MVQPHYQYTEKQKNEQIIRLIISKRFRVLRHALFLVMLFIFVYTAKQIPKAPGIFNNGRLFLIYFWFVAMIYTNIYVLVPRFFFKARYFLYLLLLTIMVVTTLLAISYIANTYMEAAQRYYPENSDMSIGTGIIITISIIFMTTTIKLFGRWTQDRETITELSNLTLQMELSELRNQINPHFLFNMLNNVKALIRIDPAKASTVILKLSDFLRYQLYENGDNKTTLSSELHFLSNLSELEKLRRDHLNIDLQTDIPLKAQNSIQLPPNLFTTFIENAIKYSADIQGRPERITIHITQKDQEQLHFICLNTHDLGNMPSRGKYGGLGLANIKRRLSLLYQDRHTLQITSTATEFLVDLTIPL
ncbi:GHKL domain-containing protein [Arachidicoccus rhizosphaerae]|uniref:GHKL domain-containing protein n=1 Tax=Arachidicoccus rhizosphaerae TaxID=551991 RepID=A0A1H4BH90_9BACT|nr:histidine kinase [Arachidicoccus rhizosphaerae]SEA47501.1 GHKL domain-containing protein [Arachidicoccus rhizosphaerae]